MYRIIDIDTATTQMFWTCPYRPLAPDVEVLEPPLLKISLYESIKRRTGLCFYDCVAQASALSVREVRGQLLI